MKAIKKDQNGLEMAKGLDCTFVYGFVPNTTLEETLKASVRKIARREVFRTAHSMTIEKQGIRNDLPKAMQAKVKADLHNIWMAEGRSQAEKALSVFLDKYQAK